jgi:catechol 2,3-dioxygenase-like lactoylglutathione lyase family enzyme
LLATLFACAPLGSAVPPSPRDWQVALERARDAGWVEAVVSVSDPAPMRRFATQVAGWQVARRGTMSRDLERFYLGSAAGGTTVREWLFTDATATPGHVRLVAFARPEARLIRPAAQPWDTGGLLSLMTRSNATDAVYRAAERLGWSAYNEPVILELRDAGVTLTNVILRGPDGVNISVYERVAPRMPDDADLRRLRRPFNAMQSVRDIARARAFYEGTLGFEVVNSGDFVNERREPNNFGMPANVVVAYPIPFAILGPRRDGPTQIELVELRGVEGRDLSARARPPSLGLLALRFPVSRLATVEQRLAAAGWPLERAATEATLAPYGRVRLLAVRSPDGAWLEFFEVLQE